MQYYQALAAPLAALAETAGVPLSTDPLGASVPQPLPVDTRISNAVDTVTAVPMYLQVAGSKLGMRNDTLFRSLNAFLAQQQAVNDAQQGVNQNNSALISALLTGADLASQQIADLKAQGLVQQARLDLVQAAGAATQSQLDLNTANDILVAARVAKLESQELADALADAALQQHDANQDAQLAVLAAQQTQDEAKIATAQATADAAKASGSTLLNVQLGDLPNKLAGSFTATMQTTGLVTVAVGASTAEVFVIHL